MIINSYIKARDMLGLRSENMTCKASRRSQNTNSLVLSFAFRCMRTSEPKTPPVLRHLHPARMSPSVRLLSPSQRNPPSPFRLRKIPSGLTIFECARLPKCKRRCRRRLRTCQ
jgi:hypothetical protein